MHYPYNLFFEMQVASNMSDSEVDTIIYQHLDIVAINIIKWHFKEHMTLEDIERTVGINPRPILKKSYKKLYPYIMEKKK